MLIKFQGVPKRGYRNPIRYGNEDDVHVAVCGPYALKVYEQAFFEDPSSKYHSLINDVMDTGDASDPTFTALVGIDWDADMRATWAMLRAADLGTDLNKDVEPVPADYMEFLKQHAADTIDFLDLHEVVAKAAEATFPSLSSRLAKVAAEAGQGE